jgi:copper oxidase (laccase) domain-containing protein
LSSGFVGRVDGVEVGDEKRVVVGRLRPVWEGVLSSGGWGPGEVWWAEQVHGARVAVVPDGGEAREVAGVDGLVGSGAGVGLAVVVADCCAVFVVDPLRRVCGLFHSGRRGTEMGITALGIGRMASEFGSDPLDLLVSLSPCIRPPAFEVDIAAGIIGQAVGAGVPREQVFDAGVCTAREAGRYYSYRRERGRTGRMLAFLGFPAAGGRRGTWGGS